MLRIRGRALEGLCGLCGPGDDSGGSGPAGLHDVQARLAARGGLGVLLRALGEGFAGRGTWALWVVRALANVADNPLLAVRTLQLHVFAVALRISVRLINLSAWPRAYLAAASRIQRPGLFLLSAV